MSVQATSHKSNQQPNSSTDFLRKSKLTQSISREHGFEPLKVEGKLPVGLSGTLYRNGPGLFELFGKEYDHLFEGDGAISGVRIADGQATGAHRLVRSEGLQNEQKAGRMIYGFRAGFTDWVRNIVGARMKNTANTNVVHYQGRLLALMEAAPPTQLHADTLETIGETDLGCIKRAFSAHPHYVPTREAAYNFGVDYGPKTTLSFYALPNRGKAMRLKTLQLEHPPMLHDFIVTEKHMIVLLPPVVVNIPRAVFQWGSFEKMFEWHPQNGVEVIVVPIDNPDGVVRFKTDAFYQWHYANAFEEEDSIVIDFAKYPNFDTFSNLTKKAPDEVDGGTLTRLRLDWKNERLHFEELFDLGCEFPRIHPAQQAARHDKIYVTNIGHNVGDAMRVTSVDTRSGNSDSFTFSKEEFASEGVVAPANGADYLLVYVYNNPTEKTYLAVFDAHDLAAGPQTKVWFDHHIPITFHGNWIPR